MPDILPGQNFQDFQESIIQNLNDVLVPNLSIFIASITDLMDPFTFVFIYLLILCSIAAGPSEGDWKSTLSLFISPIPVIALLALFLFFNFAFSQFNISFVIPLIILVSFIFLVVVIGVFYSFLLAQFLSIAYRRITLALVLLITFFSIYYIAYYLGQESLVSFIAAVIPSAALGLFIKSRREIKIIKRNSK